MDGRNRYYARCKMRGALKRGRIQKAATCEVCGVIDEPAQSLHGHHHDYKKPLDVIWLCIPCHLAVHRGDVVEPRTGRRYNRSLDTPQRVHKPTPPRPIGASKPPQITPKLRMPREWWKPPSERSPEPTTEEIAAAQFVEYPE